MSLSRRLVVVVLWVGLLSAPLSAETIVCSSPPEGSEEEQSILDELCPKSQAELAQQCLQLTSTAEFNSHQYAMSFRQARWSEARERCHQCGYYLAQINSQAELDFIKNWLTSTGIYDPKTIDFTHFQTYVDGSQRGHDGCWVWTYPKVAKWTLDENFRFFGPDQPDNWGGIEGRNSLWQKQLDGNDVDGEKYEPFICERNPAEPLTNLPSLDEVDTAPCE